MQKLKSMNENIDKSKQIKTTVTATNVKPDLQN